MRWALCLALVASHARAQPSPSPQIIGRLDVNALDHAARRNQLIGNVFIGVGAGIGLASFGLLIASAARPCPSTNPGCNDVLDVSGNWVGASGLLFLSVGISVWMVGVAQARIVKKLR